MATKIFDREKIADAGALVESALFTEKIDEKQNILLEYVKIFIECRNARLEQITDQIIKLDRQKRKIKNDAIEIDQLNHWIRGSRKMPNDTLSKEEEQLLYNRVIAKLEEQTLD